MLKIKALLSKICYQLSLIDDYITDYGKSGNWEYKKYASGRVEAEGYVSFSSLTFAASGNLYRSISNSYNIPSGIFSATPTHAEAFIQGSNMVYVNATAGVSSATSGAIQIWKSTSGNVSSAVSIHVRLSYRGGGIS